MSARFPVLAALAAEVTLGYKELDMRLHARIEQLQMLAVAGLAVFLIVGYQVARWRGYPLLRQSRVSRRRG